jgi:hypothetical protein
MMVKPDQEQLMADSLALVFPIDNTSDAARHTQRYNVVRVILSPRYFTGIQVETSLYLNEDVMIILKREE